MKTLVAIIASIAFCTSVWQLERLRSGIEIRIVDIGGTPATRYRLPGGESPLVVVAHGFAGSRQLMQAQSLNLARAGYDVLAYDLLGHGRNPVPMAGDVTRVDGTTALLVAETRRVLAAGRAMNGADAGTALLGHSMASDVIVRAARAEADAGRPIDAVIALSMFSPAVVPDEPARLLMLSGEWEGGLRAAALDALRQVDPAADEGQTARADRVVRRAAVAPHVEHVGVLYSSVALDEARRWLDAGFGRSSDGPAAGSGPWTLLLLAATVALFRPLAAMLPGTSVPASVPARPVPARRFLLAVLLPLPIVPLVATALPTAFLPVLVADYLAVHLALYGSLQLLILAPWLKMSWQELAPRTALLAVLLLVGWGIGVFGIALDRYAASFLPIAERLPIIAALCVGTWPFMLADSLVSGAGHGPWWRRIVVRLAFVLSLGVAVALQPGELGFVLIVLPVVVLFYLVHGLMGRWVAQRCGPLAAGSGLALILAWAIGVSFPLFSA